MKARVWLLAIGTAAGSAGVLTLYLAIISRQGNQPAVWAVVVLVLGVVLPILAATLPRIRPTSFAIAATLLTVLGLLAAFSIGLLLLPFAALAWAGLASSAQRTSSTELADTRTTDPLSPSTGIRGSRT